LAGALKAQRQRGDGAESKPCFHGAEDAARKGAPLVDLLTQLGIAKGNVAQEDIAMAGHGFCIGGNGEVGAESER
jgi:hypothetical protein